jgi:hypothetical protein
MGQLILVLLLPCVHRSRVPTRDDGVEMTRTPESEASYDAVLRLLREAEQEGEDPVHMMVHQVIEEVTRCASDCP